MKKRHPDSVSREILQARALRENLKRRKAWQKKMAEKKITKKNEEKM